MTDSEASPAAPQQSAKPSQRTALLVLGLIGAIAIGFAIGFLVRIPFGDNDSAPAPDSVDVGFAQDMSVHHGQAVEMATVAMTNTTDPAIKNLAFDILTTQQNQIGQMQGWLSIWGRSPLPNDGYMAWMGDDSASGHDHGGMTGMAHGGSMQKMPGMASSEDMSALRQARGPALDTLFLQLMLRHHQGGLQMMQYADQHADEAVVRDLAQTMVDTQQSESALMTQMLSQRGAAPLPMN